MDYSMNNEEISVQDAQLAELEAPDLDIHKEAIDDFLKFIDENSDYLKNGMGAFHTDNHSNW